MDDGEISAMVRVLMAVHHLNQEELAEHMTVSSATLSRRLDKGQWRVSEIHEIAAAFGVPIETVMYGFPALAEALHELRAVARPVPEFATRVTTQSSPLLKAS